jgi:hypothetical protein
MPTIFKLDSSEFNQTVEKYIALSKKELVNEVNRRAANVCARAISETPRANIDRIVEDMKAVETVTASYVKTTKKRGEYIALSKGGRTTQGQATVGYMGRPEAFAIANWRLKRGKARGFYQSFPKNLAGPGRGKSGGTASQYFSRFVKRARSSSGYIAAGWLKAYRFFASIATGQKLKPDRAVERFFKRLKGSAGRGRGIAATAEGDRVRAVFFNAAEGVERIGKSPLLRAMKIEEEDMKVYIRRKEQENLNKLAR